MRRTQYSGGQVDEDNAPCDAETHDAARMQREKSFERNVGPMRWRWPSGDNMLGLALPQRASGAISWVKRPDACGHNGPSGRTSSAT